MTNLLKYIVFTAIISGAAGYALGFIAANVEAEMVHCLHSIFNYIHR